jgi:hypothetical protein
LLSWSAFQRCCSFLAPDFCVNAGTKSKDVHGHQAVQRPALSLKILDRFPCFSCRKCPFKPLPANPVALGLLHQIVEKTV